MDGCFGIGAKATQPLMEYLPALEDLGPSWSIRFARSLGFPDGFNCFLLFTVTGEVAGRRVVSASVIWLKIWNLETGAELHTLQNDEGVQTVAVMPDGRLAVFAGFDKTLPFWDLATGAVVRTLRGN